MRRKNIFEIMFLASLFLICFWFFYLRSSKESKLLAIGLEIVHEIELYRKSNNRLPDILAQVGILEDENTELLFHYNKIDSIHYMIWLGISFEESRFYYSDSSKWQNYIR